MSTLKIEAVKDNFRTEVKTLGQFIVEWNMGHLDDVVFSASIIPVVNRPDMIEVRFPATKYLCHYYHPGWDVFCGMLKKKLDQLATVRSNSYDFSKGMISIGISAQSPGYSTERILAFLSWIGESFLPSIRS